MITLNKLLHKILGAMIKYNIKDLTRLDSEDLPDPYKTTNFAINKLFVLQRTKTYRPIYQINE